MTTPKASTSYTFRTPRPLPGEVPWTPPHNYDCDRGHVVQAERPVTTCPAYVNGEACPGQLTPYGRGSRTVAA